MPERQEQVGRPEVVVITGASAGVGRATARAFGARGACVGLIARASEGLEAAAREIEHLGGRALALPIDVAIADDVEYAAARVEETFGAIDVWVNNAMATIFAPFAEITPEEFRRATEVTYLGYVHGTMAALKRMRPRNRGSIVQVGSALAYRAIPLQAPYCGAKFAIRGFTDSLRSELSHERSKVHITMVQMPALNTPHSTGAATSSPNARSPCRRSSSPRSRRAPSCSLPTRAGARSGSAVRQSARSSSTSSYRDCWTITSQ